MSHPSDKSVRQNEVAGKLSGRVSVDRIRVRGARVHHLKNLDVEIPLERLTVMTGVSGSGKSSLAYDTIFAEGRRTYLESLSPRVRQLAGVLEPVDVDAIEGLPPPLSVAQHPGNVQIRSTVGTVTEANDFLRVLYARAGIPHCPECGTEITQSNAEEIIERILALETGRKVMLLAPLVRGKKGTHAELLAEEAKEGFVRARIDGELHDLAMPPKLAKTKAHTIELVIDRIIIKEGLRDRLKESVHLTLRKGNGSCLVVAQTEEGWEDHLYSSRYVCPACGLSLTEIEPRTFSFNSPYGACETCSGMGVIAESIPRVCPDCDGERLGPVGRKVTVGGISLPGFQRLNLEEAGKQIGEWLRELKSDNGMKGFKEGTAEIATVLLRSLGERLEYLLRVGLGYLSLDRAAITLSGGEFQRVRLGESLGNRLCGACYILDEPTAGLHPLDTGKLVEVLRELRDQGNTLIVIEHDLQVIEAADHLIELGPGAGIQGGSLVAAGRPDEIRNHPESITGPYLKVKQRRLLSEQRDCTSVEQLFLRGATLHNLKTPEVGIPLKRFVCVTGVSGSGKSSLLSGCLLPLLKRRVAEATGQVAVGTGGDFPQELGELSGVESLQRVVEVDQSPLGRNSRSNPATASGIWNEIRRLFAATREARARGFSSGRFSMTSPEGRCPVCRGSGTRKLSMEFLSDLEVPCRECRGSRFNAETLSVHYKGLNVAEVLKLSVNEALNIFAAHVRIARILQTFSEVGLGYLTLGQSATTLSGGESQRVKLAAALTSDELGKTLYFLDEPTSGLHAADTRRLIELLQRLVTQGNSLVLIEHQPEIIGAADWIMELGPGGGPAGGNLVEQMPPAELVKSGDGPTAGSLRSWMGE